MLGLSPLAISLGHRNRRADTERETDRQRQRRRQRRRKEREQSMEARLKKGGSGVVASLFFIGLFFALPPPPLPVPGAVCETGGSSPVWWNNDGCSRRRQVERLADWPFQQRSAIFSSRNSGTTKQCLHFHKGCVLIQGRGGGVRTLLVFLNVVEQCRVCVLGVGVGGGAHSNDNAVMATRFRQRREPVHAIRCLRLRFPHTVRPCCRPHL